MITKLGVLLFSLAPFVAAAADWQPVFRARDGIEYSIDKATVHVISGDERMVEAWDRERLPYPRGLMQLDDRLINNARRLVVHDCERHEIEIIRFEVYFDNWFVGEIGDPWFVGEGRDPQFSLLASPYVWRSLAAPPYVLPGSGGEAIHQAVCELGAKQRM